MTSYSYRAVTAEGLKHRGTLTAANEDELAHMLASKNLELIEARATKATFHNFTFSNANIHKQRRNLCLQMKSLLRAGLKLEDALQMIGGSLPQGLMKDTLIQIEKAVLSGHSVRQAFAQHDTLFDDVFLSILSAGEATGDLVSTFETLAKHLERQAALRATLIRAVRYPLFLLALAFGVITFMMTLVVPQIVDFLLESGTALPLATRILIAIAQFFTDFGWAFPPVLCAMVLCALGARRMGEDIALACDSLFLRLPIGGELIRKLALARLTGSLSLLLSSGLTLSEALPIAQGTLKNTRLIQSARAAHKAMLHGDSFSVAARDLLPPFAVQMVRMAEASGTLQTVLADIAQDSEQEAHEAVQSFLSALEPALTLAVGSLLAWVVLAVLGPVYGALAPLSAGM